MTTTTTSNLNLEKPDVGSEANNWGNIINSSLDDVDKAIAQRLVKPVGGSSDVTLTLTDSKFAVIEFTGTLSGNISVKTYANDAKPYIVFNNTSGSFSLTFKTNTGGGVVITQGQKTIVYSDGTNMVSAVDTSQLSVSRTITLSGDVTGSVATNLSTNPTITTAIGSGVIVNDDVNTSAAIDASKIADGSVSNTEFQRLDGVTSDIQTQINSKLNTSGGTLTGDVNFTDNQTLSLGTGNDITIKHDGGNSYLDGGNVGAFYIRGGTSGQGPLMLTDSAGGNRFLVGNDGGSTELHYNGTNAKKLETTTSGVEITGNITASGSINASASGLTGPLPAIDGSALTGISSSPSTGGIGDIRPFLLMRASGSGGSVSLSAGTTFTPSSYSSSNMLIADYGTSVQTISISTNTQRYGALNGYASLGQHQSGSSSGYSGTWRVIFPLISGTGSGGQGNSSYTYYYSLAGMAMRIS